MSGIRSLHINRGYDDLELFRHPVLQMIVAGIKRKNGDPDTRERLPITCDLLLKLLATLDQANQAQATLNAAYCLAFAAFLRAGEITYTQTEAQDPSFTLLDDRYIFTQTSCISHFLHQKQTLSVAELP